LLSFYDIPQTFTFVSTSLSQPITSILEGSVGSGVTE